MGLDILPVDYSGVEMKIRLMALLILLGYSAIITGKTMNTDGFKSEIAQLIDNKKSVTELSGIQIALVKNGKLSFAHAAGFAHLSEQGEKTALTTLHKIRIASISKFVLSLGFMRLVEQGKINLDSDVSEYLGFNLRNPNFPESKITARQLLSHTSSIRDAGHYFLAYGEDFRDFFRPSIHYQEGAHFASDANQQPGDYFTYANLNFGILAGIIESVTKQRFDRYMEQSLFKPLGLDISFNSCRFANTNHQKVATLYRRGMGGETWAPEGPWLAQVDDSLRTCYYGGKKVSFDSSHELPELDQYIPGSNPTLFSPQGGLRASALDLAKLVEILLDEADNKNKNSDKILSQAVIQQILTPVWQYDERKKNGHSGGEAAVTDLSSQGLKKAYGLSTHIINLKDWGLTEQDSQWYGHMGAAYGLLGQLWFNPETKEAVVILLTGMGDNPELIAKTTPMDEVESQVLRIALSILEQL